MYSCITVFFLIQGLEKTKNGHFGGGNTAWEEKNLLTYANSEVRFVEIQDSLCTEVSHNQDMVILLHKNKQFKWSEYIFYLSLVFSFVKWIWTFSERMVDR